jgi:hypothetical protein
MLPEPVERKPLLSVGDTAKVLGMSKTVVNDMTNCEGLSVRAGARAEESSAGRTRGFREARHRREVVTEESRLMGWSSDHEGSTYRNLSGGKRRSASHGQRPDETDSCKREDEVRGGLGASSTRIGMAQKSGFGRDCCDRRATRIPWRMARRLAAASVDHEVAQPAR